MDGLLLTCSGICALQRTFHSMCIPTSRQSDLNLVAMFAIREQEKISVSTATTAQVAIFIFAQITTPKAAPILFTQGVLETETLGSPVDYVKHVIHCKSTKEQTII